MANGRIYHHRHAAFLFVIRDKKMVGCNLPALCRTWTAVGRNSNGGFVHAFAKSPIGQLFHRMAVVLCIEMVRVWCENISVGVLNISGLLLCKATQYLTPSFSFSLLLRSLLYFTHFIILMPVDPYSLLPFGWSPPCLICCNHHHRHNHSCVKKNRICDDRPACCTVRGRWLDSKHCLSTTLSDFLFNLPTVGGVSRNN